MSHHATETCTVVTAIATVAIAMQHPADIEQAGFIGLDAGAMTVGIYFDPHLEGLAMSAAELRDGLRGLEVIDDQFEIATRAPQRQRSGQFRRNDTDGVQDVAEACREKLLGFLERGHRDAASARIALRLRDLDALRRLHMRPERNAERVHPALHACDVSFHAHPVDQCGGGLDLIKSHDVDVPFNEFKPRSHGSSASSVGASSSGACAPCTSSSPTRLCQYVRKPVTAVPNMS